MSEKDKTGKTQSGSRPLLEQTGFWRRVEQADKLQPSDLTHLSKGFAELGRIMGEVRRHAPAELAAQLEQLHERVEKDYGTQALIIQSLIEILVQKGVMTEDEFVDKMDEIDLRDGKRDGTLSSPVDE